MAKFLQETNWADFYQKIGNYRAKRDQKVSLKACNFAKIYQDNNEPIVFQNIQKVFDAKFRKLQLNLRE